MFIALTTSFRSVRIANVYSTNAAVHVQRLCVLCTPYNIIYDNRCYVFDKYSNWGTYIEPAVPSFHCVIMVLYRVHYIYKKIIYYIPRVAAAGYNL